MLAQILHDSGHVRGAVDGVGARDEALRLVVAVSLCPWDAKRTKLRVSARAAPDYVRIGKVSVPLGNGVCFLLLQRATLNAFNLHIMSNNARAC